MTIPSATSLLFVYGTLRRSGCRHHLLAKQRYLGAVRTLPRYALFHLGDYPGLVGDETAGQQIQGELYEVEQSLRARLDREEGAPQLFCQLPIEIMGHNAPIGAYYYRGDLRGRPRILSGDWCELDES